MIRHYGLYGITAALALLAGGVTLAQNAPAEKPAGAPASSPTKQLPTLAVIGSVDETAGQGARPGGLDRENMEDLLAMELGQQPFFKLVDRQAFQAVMKEHAVALSNLSDAKSASVLGKFAGADYLLHVLVTRDQTVAAHDKASVRLVEVATGQVKLEDEVKLSADLALFCAAIREKVLAALRPESQAANRLTVGIAEFPNRSGTNRSDKLSDELQKVLRSRLKDKAWAVVLERQYPTALLDEVDLARAGLVREKAVETLPPADLVIFGSMQDVSTEYIADKPWDVKLDLMLRLREHSSLISEKCRSDAVEAAADRIMAKIDEFHRQPVSQTAVPEKELWRRQALYLMPRCCETWWKAICPNFFWSNDLTKLDAIRTWENVLLLDANDPEAMTYLGVCLIGFNRWSPNKAAVAQCIAGSRLVERAFRMQPNDVRADTYIASIGAIRESAPARAKEMAQYVVDHREEFRAPDHYWVKSALTSPQPRAVGNRNAPRTDWDINALHADWNRLIQNAEKDPESVVLGFMQRPGDRGFPTEQAAVFLAQHLDSPDPVVQFVAQRAVGQQLCRKGDAAGLQHFDKAIELLEKAYSRCSRNSFFLDNVYQWRIEGCQVLGLKEEAKETGTSGTRHFMQAARFNDSIAWLYLCCVKEVLGAGQEKEAIAICDAYLAATKKEYWYGRTLWPEIATKRECLMAKLAGKPAPDQGSLRLVKGTEGTNLLMLRIAPMGENLWIVSGMNTMYGKALVLRNDGKNAASVPAAPPGVRCVAATSDAVYFGAADGLYKLGADGELLKHYQSNQKNTELPGNSILDVCEGRSKIYFAFQGSGHTGVAVLDPATDKISVLAPSSHEATQATEPLAINRIRWDAATPRLYACFYQYPTHRFQVLTHEYSWTPQDKAWQPYPRKDAPWMVVSQGDEALVVRVLDDRTEFRFVKAGQKITAPVPVPQLMGEPAWDDNRIWVPTSSGLYEVDRTTGQVRWLAYEADNPFISLLKADTRLYVATQPRAVLPRDSADAGERSHAIVVAERSGQTCGRAEGDDNGETFCREASRGVDNTKAEITITRGRTKAVQKASLSTVQLNLTEVGDGPR